MFGGRSCYFLILLLTILLVSNSFAAAVYSEWRGADGGNWFTPSNWNNGIVPYVKDTVGYSDPNLSKGGDKGWGSSPYTVRSPGLTTGITVACDQFTLGGTLIGPSGFGGKLQFDGAIMNLSEYLTMGANTGENGVLYMNSGMINTGLLYNNAHLFIGQKGSGTVYMEGGVINLISVNPGNLRIADQSGSSGKLYLDAGTIYANDLLMPYAAAGSMVITGGKLVTIGNDISAINALITAGKVITTVPNGTISVTYNSGTNRTTVLVPEPTTVCLLALGVLGLLRRKK